MTLRLFDQDVDLLTFTARVLACEPEGARWEVVLDQTAFFPEGGGQGADHGTLGGAQVLDAQETGGIIRHVTDAPLPVGDTVEGRVEPIRRLSMMQQHTGEHILSGLICQRHGYRNVGFHIGTDAVTLDFNGPLTEDDIRQAERLANECIWRDQPVEVWVPSPEELAQLEYRSKKALEGDVRIVRIQGIDTCACCGTHVHTTGQVGQIKVMGAIHYKGGMRLSILCGMRALDAENALLAENRAVGQLLSAKAGEMDAATRRLMQERDELRLRCEQVGMRLFRALAAQQEAESVRILPADMLAPSQLRKAAGILAEGAQCGLTLIPRDAGWNFALCSRTQDVRPLAKALNARFGGRSGGAADMVQGMLESGTQEEISACLRGLRPFSPPIMSDG